MLPTPINKKIMCSTYYLFYFLLDQGISSDKGTRLCTHTR